VPKRNLAWILVVVTIALLMWQLPQFIAVRDSVYEAFGPLVEVRAEIHNRFVEDVPDTKLVDAAVDAGIKAMVAKLHDPYAVYLNHDEYERSKSRTEGVFGGIGVEVWATDEGLEVLSRVQGSHAAEEGILPGEIITQVDGQSTRGVPLVEAVNNLLNGQPGSEIVLTIKTPGAEAAKAVREVRLQRELIRLNPIEGWSRGRSGERFMLDPDAGIGYMRLIKFTPDAAERMDAVIDQLLRQNLRGLVLDLRDNTGGVFESGLSVADRFLDSGLIVRQSGRKTDEKEWYAQHEGNYPDFGMAVLINGSTASAAELVAGALRDHQRAAIVGERSYGKGCVQEVLQLQHGGGAIKLTTAYFYLPRGQCIQRTPEAAATGEWGVRPTLPISLTDDERRLWLATRREVTREDVPPQAAQEGPETSQPTEELDRESDAEALLAADLQLHRAVEYLRDRIEPERQESEKVGVPHTGSAPAVDHGATTKPAQPG
jgi:carboxyl-terminal processing protease